MTSSARESTLSVPSRFRSWVVASRRPMEAYLTYICTVAVEADGNGDKGKAHLSTRLLGKLTLPSTRFARWCPELFRLPISPLQQGRQSDGAWPVCLRRFVRPLA